MDEIDAALERLSAQLGKPELQEWLANRKEAGQKLDPETAVMACVRRQALEYGICRDYPRILNCFQRGAWKIRAHMTGSENRNELCRGAHGGRE
jgi:hypothetical protein